MDGTDKASESMDLADSSNVPVITPAQITGAMSPVYKIDGILYQPVWEFWDKPHWSWKEMHPQTQISLEQCFGERSRTTIEEGLGL